MDERDYEGFVGFTDRPEAADLSPDGRLLAIGRTDSRTEVWDLAEMKPVRVVGDALPPDAENPGLGGAQQARWFADGRHLAVYRESEWQVFDADGRRLPSDADTRYGWYAAVSPVAPLLAVSEHERLAVVRIGSSGRLEPVHEWKLERWNGGRRRVEFSPDGARLLVTDLLGIWVFDLASGKRLFRHHELDLRLPPPMIADEKSGVRAPSPATRPTTLPSEIEHLRGSKLLGDYEGPSQVACLDEGRLSPDGGFIAVIYSDSHEISAFFVARNPQTYRLRFYDASTGELQWDHLLPLPPRSLAFSRNGNRLYVVLTEDFSSRLQVYDTARRQLVGDIPYKRDHRMVSRVVPLRDERFVVSLGVNPLLTDTDGRFASVVLPGSPNVGSVLVTPDGERIIEVGAERTARIWRQRRPMSATGAVALPETWAVYAASVLLIGGAAIIAGRGAARRRGRPLPVALWVFALLASLGLGLSLAHRVIEPIVDPIYSAEPETLGGNAFGWAVLLFCVASLIGTIRLKRGWWIAQVVIEAFSLLAAIVISALLLVASGRLPPQALELTLHGWRISGGALPVMVGAFVITVWTFGQLLLLLTPPVRALYAPDAATATRYPPPVKMV